MNSLPPKQQCSQAILPNSNMATYLQSGNSLSSKHSVNEAVNNEAPDASKMESIQIFFLFFDVFKGSVCCVGKNLTAHKYIFKVFTRSTIIWFPTLRMVL